MPNQAQPDRLAFASKRRRALNDDGTPALTIAELIDWHTYKGVEAMRRADDASTRDCRIANEIARDFHRCAVELLATLVRQ